MEVNVSDIYRAANNGLIFVLVYSTQIQKIRLFLSKYRNTVGNWTLYAILSPLANWPISARETHDSLAWYTLIFIIVVIYLLLFSIIFVIVNTVIIIINIIIIGIIIIIMFFWIVGLCVAH